MPRSDPTTPYSTDPRRAIPRHIWLTNRARNALQRPAFIGAISVGTFVTAIVSMVVVPRTQQQPAPVIKPAPRPDTLSPIASAAEARAQMLQIDSVIADARRQIAAAVAAAPPADTVAPDTALNDSVRVRVDAFDHALARAEQAPLPASYKAIAELPELRGDARIRALVDSLNEIEREREGFGAVGGVDPIFVALTSRANEIGRAIQGIATSHRDALRREIVPAPRPAAPVAVVPAIDTVKLAMQRDSARVAFVEANDSLKSRRATSRALDIQEDQARERASAVAPPLALLAAAFVLSAVIGFAAALIGELRRPRVSDASEIERLLGVRVLSTVEASMPSIERGRRQADRAAPPYLDPGAEAYQLAYLGLATEHPALLSANITGDDAATVAVVACNLAAVAAEEARNTLVIDLDPSCMVAATLRARPRPGIAEMVRDGAAWPDATVTAGVGRDKTVDLVPSGLGTPTTGEVRELLSRDGNRLARYYDAVFTVLAPRQAEAGVLAALPSPEAVYCARPGTTSLRTLRDELDAIRAAGGRVRGIVLWNADRPTLPAVRELAERSGRRRTAEAEPALARS